MSCRMSPGCLKFSKMSVFALNLILWLIGVVGVCFAGFYFFLITKVDSEDRPDLWSGSYSHADAERILLQARLVMCILTIVTGSFVVIVGFLGCCGAASDHKGMLVVHAGLLGIALAVQVIVIGVIVWQNNQAPHIIEEIVLTKIKYSDEYNGNDWKAIHAVQREMKCCGVNSYKDYLSSNHSVPLSCCNVSLTTADDYLKCNGTADQPHALTNVSLIFRRGCGAAIRNTISSYVIIGYCVLSLLILLELVGLVFSCVVIRSLGSRFQAAETVRRLSRTPDEVQPLRLVPPAYDSPGQQASSPIGTV